MTTPVRLVCSCSTWACSETQVSLSLATAASLPDSFFSSSGSPLPLPPVALPVVASNVSISLAIECSLLLLLILLPKLPLGLTSAVGVLLVASIIWTSFQRTLMASICKLQ